METTPLLADCRNSINNMEMRESKETYGVSSEAKGEQEAEAEAVGATASSDTAKKDARILISRCFVRRRAPLFWG